MADDANRLCEAIPIESYIARFVALKKKGNNHWGLCPFHSENTPSFSVSPEKGIFKCFGCGKGGNLISFVREYERTDFLGALKILSEYSGIPLSRRGNTPRNNQQKLQIKRLLKASSIVSQWYLGSLPHSSAQAYLKDRNVSPDAVQQFSIGYAPDSFRFIETKAAEIYKNDATSTKEFLASCQEIGLISYRDSGESYNRFKDRLIFPIKNMRGEVIAFGGRLVAANSMGAKYVNSPESLIFSKKKNLYHLYEAREAIRKAGQAILVEGYFDVLGLSQSGFENTIAPLGTAFTPEQAKIIKRFTDRLIVFFDNDQAGIEASYKSCIIARKAQISCRVLIGKHEKSDPFDLAQSLSKVELFELLDSAKSELDFFIWYFFQYKNDSGNFNGGRKAIEDLFQFLRLEVSSEFEVSSFLKSAAKIVEVDVKVLEKDFRHGLQNAHATFSKKEYQKQQTKIPFSSSSRTDREILALLLWEPTLWKENVLLNDHAWNSQESVLMYGFLRDRLQSGEVFSWNNITQAIHSLPQELSSFLAGISIEFEDDLLMQKKSPEKKGVDLQNRLKGLLLESSIKRHREQEKKINMEIEKEQQKNPLKADQLSIKFIELQRKIKQKRDELNKLKS